LPRCANGHFQALGLKCKACGLPLSYREATNQLLDLPSVQPDFGRTAALYVGVPPTVGDGGFSIRISSGNDPVQTKNEFVLGKIQGGTWHDFYTESTGDLIRWLGIVAYGESTFKFLFADAADPLSVLAVSALPQLRQTAMVAMTADQESTPVEQNASYVAIAAALKRGFHVLALPRSLARQSLAVEESGEPSSPVGSFSRVVSALLGLQDELMDLLEKDRHIGVGFHLLLPVVSGSMQVYGKASNVFAVQSYQLPQGVRSEDVKTFHALVSCEKEQGGEFEEGFTQFRNKAVRSALSAECRVQPRADTGSFDVFTICGLDETSVLKESEDGYNAVAKRAPALKVESLA
jgi:hypothetical protein